MKKKLLSGIVILGAASMLCGFDSAETLDSLSAKMDEAVASYTGVSAETAMNLDASLEISDGTTVTPLDILLSGDMAFDMAMDPIALQANVAMNVSMFGEGDEIAEEMYMVAGDSGEYKMYIKVTDPGTGEETWMVQPLEGLDVSTMSEAAASESNFSEMAEWGVVFELAPEAADVNGTECYLISTTIDASTLSTIISRAGEQLGQDFSSEQAALDTVLSMLTGLQINVAYYVDAATYLPIRATVDMDGSDYSIINTLINSYLNGMASEEAPASTTSLTVSDASIDILMNYGDAPTVTVPQEALDAEASGSAASVDDLAAAVEG